MFKSYTPGCSFDPLRLFCPKLCLLYRTAVWRRVQWQWGSLRGGRLSAQLIPRLIVISFYNSPNSLAYITYWYIRIIVSSNKRTNASIACTAKVLCSRVDTIDSWQHYRSAYLRTLHSFHPLSVFARFAIIWAKYLTSLDTYFISHYLECKTWHSHSYTNSLGRCTRSPSVHGGSFTETRPGAGTYQGGRPYHAWTSRASERRGNGMRSCSWFCLISAIMYTLINPTIWSEKEGRIIVVWSFCEEWVFLGRK